MGSEPSFACFGLFSSGIREALEGLSGNLMSRTAMDDAHTLSSFKVAPVTCSTCSSTARRPTVSIPSLCARNLGTPYFF